MRYRRIPNLGQDYMQTIERVNLLERIVQAIGFTPDFPYTLNVNDGTRNRVLIGKINGDYGIKIVNNAGVEIVFADGHISATGITTGTLDTSLITVTNLSAGSITTGTLTASRISGGTLNCSLMTVSNLSASSITTGSMSGARITTRTISADRISTNSITADELSVGTIITQSAQIKDGIIGTAHIGTLNASVINAGTLNVDRLGTNSIAAVKLAISQISDIATNIGSITSGTITGATLRTSSSGQRVELTSADYINLISANGGVQGRIYGEDTGLRIKADGFGGTGYVSISGNDTPIGVSITGTVGIDYLYAGSSQISGLSLNDNNLTEVKAVLFNEKTSYPSSSDSIWYYKSGGSYGFRTRMEGGNWAITQSSV